MTNKSVSHYKLITLLAFICVALMTLVFVFHSSQKTIVSRANNNVTTFSVPRDIKDFNLVTKDNKKFALHDLRNHVTLLFFGFTHCSNVCPTTMEMLNRAYSKLQKDYPDLQVVLVSLDPNRDKPNEINKYAQSFNPAFIGVTGKIAEIRKLQSQLGIYSGQNDTQGDYQIEHTATIMLVDKEGKWAGIFKYGMSPEQFAQEFRTSVRI